MFNIYLLLALPKAKSNKQMVSSSGSLNGNLCDKPEELTFPLKGDESSIERPQTHPSSRCLSKPLCIQATFFFPNVEDLISARIASCQSLWNRANGISDREKGL